MLRGHTFIGGFSQESSKMIGASKRLRISAYLSASFLLIFGLMAVFPVASSISDTSAAQKDLKQTSISMSASSFYINPKVTSATGTFSSSSTQIGVSTDNYTGYTIGIAAKTDDSDATKLLSADGELNSISSATSEEDFSAASGTSLNGLWGYKPSKLNSVANTDFLPAPSFEGDEINKTSGANEQADIYTISLGARADASTAYGRYKNAFVIRTVANPVGVSFTYNKNTEDAVSNMPVGIAASISDEKITVSDTVPVRSGYELTGWCDGTTKRILNVDYCEENNKYNIGDDYYLDRSEASVTVELYAMWKPTGSGDFICNSNATTISEAVCMQDINNDIKQSMVEGQQYSLFDSRDGKEYYISKLHDGKVWMTQNLGLELSTSQTLTHSDTDLGWADYDENASWTPAKNTLSAGSPWSDSDAEPQTLRTGEKYYIPSGTNQSDKSYSLEECIGITGSKEQCMHGESGVLYNWTAAVATNNPNSDELTTNNSIAPDSVCPKGWRLPYGIRPGNTITEKGSDWGRLLYSYGIISDPSTTSSVSIQDSTVLQMESTPMYLARAGYIYDSDGLNYKGEFGAYFSSSTRIESNSMYAIAFRFATNTSYSNSGYLYSSNTWEKSSGLSIRCVARDKATITFDANGGEGTMPSITIYGDTLLPENQFTKTDKSFVGWNTAADGSGTSYSIKYSDSLLYPLRDASSDVTLYAQWRDKTIITYDGNSADSGNVDAQRIDYGKSVEISSNGFLRDGYAFVGWNTAADGSGADYYPGDMYEANVVNGENITLYAKWKQAQVHTVNYVSSSGTNAVEYNCGGGSYSMTKYSHTENIDDTGVQLSNYGNNWGNENIVGSDRGDSSKAHVVKIPGATQITVYVYYNGQSTSYDWVSVWEGSHPEYTAKDNYSSEGVRAQKLGGSQSTTQTINGNTVRYVGYSGYLIYGDTVTLSFTSDDSGYGRGYGYYAIITGNANDFGCDVKNGQYVDATDTETGGFLGWNQYNNQTTATWFNENDVIKNFVQGRVQSYTTSTVYATYGKWTNISFDANGGVGSMEGVKVPYSKSVTLPNNTFTREGYEFYAWNDQQDGSGQYYEDGVSVPATNSAGDSVTLYAQWSPKTEYTVNYHDGENTNTVKYKCWDGRFENTKIAHSTNVGDDGTKNSELPGGVNSNQIITIPGATKLHVKLTYGSSSISYAWVSLWAGRDASLTAYSHYNKGLRLGTNTTGKYGGQTAGSDRTVVEGDIPGDSVTVGFYSSYNVTGYGFHLEVSYGNDAMTCEELPVQGQYLEPTGDTNDVFTGWSYDNNATLGDYMDEVAAKSSLTAENTVVDLYDIWAKPTVLKFNNNGGNGIMNDAVIKYGETARIPYNTFTYGDGVRFQRWNTSSDNTGTSYSGGNTYNATDPVGGDIILYAIWGMPTIIHFNANGGEGAMDDLLAPYQQSTYLPYAQFMRNGCKFQRWNTEPDGSGSSYYANNSFYSSTIGGGEITLYAIWGLGVTFTFDANGGEGTMEPFTITYNTTAPLPPNTFTKEDSEFAYWNTEPDNTGTRYSNETSYSASSMTGPDTIALYAIWGSPTTIVYDGNGADSGEMNDHTISYGDTISLDSNQFSKNGYVFLGWNTLANGTGITYMNEGRYEATDTYGGEHRLYAIWGLDKLDETSHNTDNRDTDFDPEPDSTPGAGEVTLARAYEIAYNAAGKGMYVPNKDPVTGNYDGTYFEATQASDYEGIPANDLRFAMQDMTTAICESVTVYDELYDKVIDLRDYKSYYISKLRDGHCWMTQNLDLDIETVPDKVATLTSENTDLNYYNPVSGSDYYNNGYSYDSNTGIITWTPSADTIRFTGTNVTVSGWGTNENTTQASADPGERVFYNQTTNVLKVEPPSSYDSIDACVLAGNYRNRCKHLLAGNYYNFATAVAVSDANNPEMNFDYNADPNPEHEPMAPNSICPKGWRLQNGGELYSVLNPSVDAYYDGYGYKNRYWFRKPLYLSRTGLISDGKQQYVKYGSNNNVVGGVFYMSNRIFHAVPEHSMYWNQGFSAYFNTNQDSWSLNNYGSTSIDFGEGTPIRCVAR